VTWNGGSRPWYRYSRPCLGQSGPLNGQHYSIRRDYSTPAAQRPPDAKSSRNPLQTKGISRSTSDPCRTTAGPLPKQHACHRRRAGNNKPARAPRTLVKQKAWAVSRLHTRPRVTQSTRQGCRRVCRPARRRAGSSRGTALAAGVRDAWTLSQKRKEPQVLRQTKPGTVSEGRTTTRLASSRTGENPPYGMNRGGGGPVGMI
jgi:hypothetical protein